MKNIISLTIAAALLSVSCLNLDEKNYSTMTAGQYYANFSDSDIPAAVGKVYAGMRYLYAGTDAHTTGSWMYTSEETCDIWLTPKRGGSWYDTGIYYALKQRSWQWDHPHILGNWRRPYARINDCNRLIYEFEKAGVQNEKLFAEIRVARAFWYYILCDLFGNVPIQTRYDVPADYLPETSTRQQVFDFIISEIEACRDLLARKAYSRWDYYSTTALLATLYLNAESWGIDTGGTSWDKTIGYCDEILTSGKYTMESDYSSPFVTENEHSGEIIMGIVNDEVYNPFEDMPWCLHLCTMHWKYSYHANTVTRYWGGVCADPAFAGSYDPEDLRFGKSWFEGQLYDNTGEYTGVAGSVLYCDPWDARDAGKPLIHTKEVPFFEGDEIPTTGEAPGVRIAKYEIREGCLNSLSNDFVLFRLPYIIFAKAEAIYHKNGNVADNVVCDLINSVRERAFANFDDSKKVKPEELDDNRFLLELGWEFCIEGYRRQQLIRFNQFNSRPRTPFSGLAPSESFRCLFPVPRQEMLANPLLEQNPGYPSID